MRKPKTKKKAKILDEETPIQNETGGTSLEDIAIDRFPTKRLNIYSSPDLLPFIRNVLRDTPDFETIRRSCFGKLFDLPTRQRPVSCKLIHSFLTRQLLCLPKNTLWYVFGGSPFRYDLEEFGTVTGLPCGSFPGGYKPNTGKKIVAGKDRAWKILFGKKKFVTVAECCWMLENDKNMSGWKKLGIALIVIVDGVLIAHKQEAHPTPRYFRMVENLNTFFAFPCGRESFLKTISCMKPPKFVPNKCEDLVATLLVFTPIIPIERQEQPGWGVWSDDDKEDIVIYLEQLIADHTPSTNKCDMPLIKKPKTRVKKKSATIKQSLKTRQPSARKQRHISSYFTRSSTKSFTNVQLTEIVIQLTKQVKQLRREMKRRKKRVHGRQSSFHTLLLRRKKSNTPTHQSEPTPNNTESLHNQDDGAMATNELPERLSPIISQYEAQLHRDSTVSPLASSPVSEPCIHTQSVHVSPDHNTRIDHPNSPEIHHILYHGVRIYDSIDPDTPIFDSSIPPHSPTRSRLMLSPQPTTQFTTPTKSNNSLSCFAVHAATVNTFTATASSNSPPCLGTRSLSHKRQSEHHLFKWIDETIIDEIRVVDSKHCQLQEDVQSFKSTTKQCLQEHGKYIDESLLELKRIIHDQKMLLFELRRDPTLPDASLESSVTKSPSPLINISASDIALGTMAWLYAKLST
ncbi:hypothetical protein Bca4012_020577 [Brassica carinata]